MILFDQIVQIFYLTYFYKTNQSGPVANIYKSQAALICGHNYPANAIKGLINRCGLAMLHKLAGGNPAQVIASHEPGIEPCRHIGNDVLDA